MGNFKLLQKSINEKLMQGDFVCLIGPNGCGKSTLIRTLSGMQSPLNGRIYINEKEIRQLTNAERSRLLSIVLTDNTVVGNITVAEIVALGRYSYTNWIGTLELKDKQILSESLNKVGLKGFESRRLNTLSDGEKQRTFIAKGLASDAPVMLLDEPTAHLDIPNKVGIMTLLRHLTRLAKHSVLVATHELDLALKLADEVWLMLPDQTIYKGTPEELIFSGNLDRVFGNELLRFDPHSGNFAFNTKPTGSIIVEGKKKNLDITLQAVNRIGFTTNNLNDNKAVRIIVSNNHWIIDMSGNKVEFQSLAETCRFLRNINE
ncbi:Vitamin B12 import ATP-binding protein BtuD [subsurface metagenome]